MYIGPRSYIKGTCYSEATLSRLSLRASTLHFRSHHNFFSGKNMAQNSGKNSGTTAQSSTPQIDPHDTLDPGESIVPDSVVRVMESIISVPNGSENVQSDAEFDVGIGTVIVVALILVALIRIVIALFPFVLGIGFITLLFMFL